MVNMNGDWKLAKVVLEKETNEVNRFRLHTEYFVTDKHGNTDRVIIDGMPLYFRNKPDFDFCATIDRSIRSSVNLGFGSIDFDEITKISEERIVSSKKKMTVEEIEKALGYKVEIVSDKEEISCNTCKNTKCPGNVDPCLSCCCSKDAYANWERKE